MTRLSTLPTAREQAHHTLTLAGAPVPARLLVDVHAALFDGDLSTAALVRLLRDEERAVAAPGVTTGVASTFRLCRALDARHLTAVGGLVALSTWPLLCRISTPVSARVDALTIVVRIAEFVAVQAGASGAAHRLLRQLAADVPGGPEAYDVLHPHALADAARAALADPRLVAAAAADHQVRQAAMSRAATLDERLGLFGAPVVPRQSAPRVLPG